MASLITTAINHRVKLLRAHLHPTKIGCFPIDLCSCVSIILAIIDMYDKTSIMYDARITCMKIFMLYKINSWYKFI